MFIEKLSAADAARRDAETAERIGELRRPLTDEETDEALADLDPAEMQALLPDNVRSGFFRRPAGKAFGFVADAFIPPAVAFHLHGETAYAVLVEDGAKGPRAKRVTLLETYVGWHRDELRAAARARASANRLSQAAFLESRQTETSRWEAMKAAAGALGFDLRAVELGTESRDYGGRGRDVYVVSGVADEGGARRLLEALGTRHAEDVQAPYDTGHDRVRLTPDGFENEWCGPWDD